MVSREKPKTIRLSQRGSVLRTGSIVERPDDRFVSRVRPRKLSGRDRVWSVRLLAEQAVARRESGRDPRGLARLVAGAPGRGETGIAASARRIRGGRDRGGGAVRLAPRRDPALSSCASGRGPIRSGRRGNSTILGRGHGTDPRDRDARRDGGPEDDPNLRSDVRWGHVRIGRRVARVVHLLPDVHQPVRPLGSPSDPAFRGGGRGRDGCPPLAVSDLEQGGGPTGAARDTWAVPGGPCALRANDTAGASAAAREVLGRRRDK